MAFSNILLLDPPPQLPLRLPTPHSPASAPSRLLSIPTPHTSDSYCAAPWSSFSGLGLISFLSHLASFFFFPRLPFYCFSNENLYLIFLHFMDSLWLSQHASQPHSSPRPLASALCSCNAPLKKNVKVKQITNKQKKQKKTPKKILVWKL